MFVNQHLERTITFPSSMLGPTFPAPTHSAALVLLSTIWGETRNLRQHGAGGSVFLGDWENKIHSSVRP
jgi:hypothetical protein